MDLTYKVIKSIVKKKKGFGANGGFDFTKELKEIFRKKKGFGANVGFGCTKKKRESIVEKYKEKRGGLGSTVDLILYRNLTNCEEK